MNQTLEQLIQEALPLFVPQEATEETVVEYLVERQVFHTLATQIVLFVPIAFGRVFMQKFHLNFPTTFTLHYPDGTVLERLPLADEPVYNTAYQLAKTIISKGEWREDFHFEIASWSSEVNVVSQALVEGFKPENLNLQELHINGDIGSRPISPLT